MHYYFDPYLTLNMTRWLFEENLAQESNFIKLSSQMNLGQHNFTNYMQDVYP